MVKVFPNLSKRYIEVLEFESSFEGDISKAREYFLKKEYTNNFEADNFYTYTEYTYSKIPYFFGLSIHFNKKLNKAKIEILIRKNLRVKKDKKIKQLSAEDFIGFYKILHGNNKIKLNQVSMTADCSLPLKEPYSFPPLIELQANKKSYITGLRFGFDKELGLDTLIVEKTNNKKLPIHFYVQTLPYFKLNKDFCNEKFFESPMNFVEKIFRIFLVREKANV